MPWKRSANWAMGPKTVSPAGVEPATFALGVQRSIQLSYGDFVEQIIAILVIIIKN